MELMKIMKTLELTKSSIGEAVAANLLNIIENIHKFKEQEVAL